MKKPLLAQKLQLSSGIRRKTASHLRHKKALTGLRACSRFFVPNLLRPFSSRFSLSTAISGLALLLLAAVFPARPARGADTGDIPDGIVRVGILDSSKSASIELRGKTKIVDLSSGRQQQLSERSKMSVCASGGGLKFGDDILGPVIRLTPLDGEDRLRINERSYRGSIVVKTNPDSTLTAVEELGIEEYLYGVLPSEMGPEWPLEALKAQAVVARTYALYTLQGASEKASFDLCADTRCQVYGGASEDPKAVEAVRATQGEVLLWNGRLVHAFFHANCGGRTSPSIWGGDMIRPLMGVRCPYCKESGNYKWSAFFSQETLLKFLSSLGHDAGRIKSIRVVKRNSGGRAVKFKFSTDAGSQTASVKDLRGFLGASEFKSAYITRVTTTSKGFRFAGRGYGHGVGMCQEGARQMAWNGRKYKQILKFYYPGAKIACQD
ncbi:MAG: SpoIID/LytB domain-containing protein [Elusimicrobiales bacterium]|nr:SpoIID/LytB domain-containing protein [Elusimicrobiales bacterium]